MLLAEFVCALVRIATSVQTVTRAQCFGSLGRYRRGLEVACDSFRNDAKLTFLGRMFVHTFVRPMLSMMSRVGSRATLLMTLTP